MKYSISMKMNIIPLRMTLPLLPIKTFVQLLKYLPLRLFGMTLKNATGKNLKALEKEKGKIKRKRKIKRITLILIKKSKKLQKKL